jgi:hypothetical protein
LRQKGGDGGFGQGLSTVTGEGDRNSPVRADSSRAQPDHLADAGIRLLLEKRDLHLW